MISEGYVYRYYDADGALLYVGSTRSFARRHTKHRIGSPWASKVQKFVVEVFPSIIDARWAEDQAILGERPIHNKYTSENHGVSGGTVNGLRRHEAAMAKIRQIEPFWPLSDSQYSINWLCRKFNISRPTLLKYMPDRATAQRKHETALKTAIANRKRRKTNDGDSSENGFRTSR